MLTEIDQLPQSWYDWLRYRWDPFCDALARGARAARGE